MGQYVQQVPVKFTTVSVAAAGTTYLDVQSYPFPLTVTALPGGGGTATVSYSTTPNAAGKTSTATWIAWPSGTVAANTSDALLSPVSGLKLEAATATATFEING